jgi:uncharacterized protein (DUF433 family)
MKSNASLTSLLGRCRKISFQGESIWSFKMNRITLEPGKRGGRPCIRGLRITVYDVLSMLSCGMTQEEILDDFPELTLEDIRSVLAYAADREHQVFSLRVE